MVTIGSTNAVKMKNDFLEQMGDVMVLIKKKTEKKSCDRKNGILLFKVIFHITNGFLFLLSFSFYPYSSLTSLVLSLLSMSHSNSFSLPSQHRNSLSLILLDKPCHIYHSQLPNQAAYSLHEVYCLLQTLAAM